MSDDYWLDMMARGQPEEGLAGLKGQYHEALLRYAKRQFKAFKIPDNYVKAPEDVVDEAWYTFYVAAQRERINVPPAYLRKLVKWSADNIRRKRRSEYLFEGDLPDDEEIDARTMRQADQLDARLAIENLRLTEILSPCQRVAFILRHGFDLKPQTIQELMGKSTNTISSSISQGKAAIRRYMKSEHYQPAPEKVTVSLYRAEAMTYASLSVPIALARMDGWHLSGGDIMLYQAHLLVPIGSPFTVDKLYFLAYVFDTSKRTRRDFHYLYDFSVNNKEYYVHARHVCHLSLRTNISDQWDNTRVSPSGLEGPMRSWRFQWFDHETERTRPMTLTRMEEA